MAKKGAAAVDRALSIVTALGDARRALTLTETASATGLYKSTALRLLASLVRAGFVDQDVDGRYRLGSAIYRLSPPPRPTPAPGRRAGPRVRARPPENRHTSGL